MDAGCAPTAERIQQLTAFFDNLVDLIPPQHYLDVEEVVNLKHMKKEERASTKAAFKKQHKETKRAKLDPDQDASTTAVQHERSSSKDAPKSAVQHVLRANVFTNASTDELRERLQAKLAAFREQRGAMERAETATQAKEWREKQQLASRQRPQKRGREGKSQGNKQSTSTAPSQQAAAPRKGKESAAAGGDDIMFNKLQVQEGRPQKQRKMSKQQLLRQAEVQAANGEDKPDTVKWDKWMKLAQGEKVLDDPQLLRKAVKKEAKLKAKKAAAWDARNKATGEKQDARQHKRQSNLQRRADDKKATKVQKREKKLMRAGFEGRTSALPPLPGS